MYRTFKPFVLSIFLLLGFSTGLAYALPGSNLRDGLPKKPSGISEGQTTLAPFGYTVFCKNNPSECQKQSNGQNVKTENGRVVLDSSRWQQLINTNASVNSKIKPKTDRQLHGQEEVWSLPKNQGDCEDYALAKYKSLTRSGWPSTALRLAVVVTPKGETHAVLIAKTTKGDFVLDNLSQSVKSWASTGYRWVKLQSGGNPMIWVDAAGSSSRTAVHKVNLQKVSGLEWNNVPQAQRDRLKALWKAPR